MLPADERDRNGTSTMKLSSTDTYNFCFFVLLRSKKARLSPCVEDAVKITSFTQAALSSIINSQLSS